jgi:hypothetical protein
MKKKSSEKKNQESAQNHEEAQKKFELNATKISELNLKGKSHWCDQKEQQIAPAICTKFQKTAGCQIGPINKESRTGCPCWNSELNAKATGKPRKKSSGPTKNSYQTIMAKIFYSDGFSTLDNLVEKINSDPTRSDVKRLADNKNVSVGISILKNASRVKNPLRIEYSRVTKLYYYLDNEIGKEKYESDMVKVESDKKAKRAKKAAEKKAAEENKK